MTCVELAKQLIEGVGGFRDYERYELPIFQHSRDVEIAIWTLMCLTNPQCEGTAEAMEAIAASRKAKAAAAEAGTPAGGQT